MTSFIEKTPNPISPINEIKFHGFDGFETFAIDGRTIGVRPKWIHIKEQAPPKDKPFMALSKWGIDILTWRTNIRMDGEDMGWFMQHSSFCCCCNGHCSMDFDLWMPLPETTKEKI